MTVDSNDVGCEEVVQQLHKQVAELQRELISRDDRVADLTREVAYWQALLRTERSAVEARRPSIDRTTQTFAGPFAVDAATDTTDDLLPTPLHSPNLGNKGAPHQRPRRVSVLEDTSGDDRAPLLLSARAPTLTRQYVTPPQLAIPAVPLLNLATPRQVAYGGQLSYRAVHQLPNGDYTHASYSPTPREQWTYQGSGLLRNLETPRTTPPLLPGRQYDSTVIDSLTAPSSPMETSPAQFDIDPEGGCGICQLANQALAFMHNHSGADEQLQLPTTQAAILRWMVEDLTRLADAHVHSTTADEQRDMLAVLKTVAASTVDTVSPPIAPIDLDSNALHHLVTSEGALTVAVRVAVEAGGAFTRGRLWATSQGLALIGVQVENSAWRLHSMVAVRCCAVKCSRSGRDGKFTVIRRREEALGAPPSILLWPIAETRMNDSLSTAANFDPQPGTVTFLAEMQDVVPLKQQLDLIASTCPHHAIQALREGAIPLALCANALIANPGVNHS